MLPYFPYIFILEKNNLTKTQITQILKNNFNGTLNLIPLKLPTHISYVLKKSFYLLSWKSLTCLKFLNWKNISNSETLCNSMIFTSEDKMTSSKHMKYELGVSKDIFKVPLKLFFNIGVIWVLFKLFFFKNKIYRN